MLLKLQYAKDGLQNVHLMSPHCVLTLLFYRGINKQEQPVKNVPSL